MCGNYRILLSYFFHDSENRSLIDVFMKNLQLRCPDFSIIIYSFKTAIGKYNFNNSCWQISYGNGVVIFKR